MGSRFLIGVSAWLLGAASATGGSLYAVTQLVPRTHVVSVAMVHAELAGDGAARHTATTPSPSPSPSAKVSHSSAPRRSVPKHHATHPVPYPLRSDGGSVEAVCGPAGAQVLGESAAVNFEIGPVLPGPSAVASVTFISTISSGGLKMNVTCGRAGVPVKQVYRFGGTEWGDTNNN